MLCASFIDRVINVIAVGRLGINVICMALLVVAEAGDGRVYAKNIETTVAIIELLLLWGENSGSLSDAPYSLSHGTISCHDAHVNWRFDRLWSQRVRVRWEDKRSVRQDLCRI